MASSKEINDAAAHKLGRLYESLRPIVERYGQKIVHDIVIIAQNNSLDDIEWMSKTLQEDIEMGTFYQKKKRKIRKHAST